MKLAPIQRSALKAAIADLKSACDHVQDALGETDECMITCNDIQDIIDNINADLLEVESN